MTTKRSKGFASLDLVLPVAPHYRTDPQVLKDVEKMRTNAASRWAKYESSYTSTGMINNNDSSSKISSLARPKIEVLRANSPTFKRLVAARIKLEKYVNATARIISASRQSIRSMRETPYTGYHDKEPSATAKPLHEKPPSSMSKPVYNSSQPAPSAPPPPIKTSKTPANACSGPLDKITYEKTVLRNGNLKQKCSLEIWLPKADVDDDDDFPTRTMTPEVTHIESHPEPMLPLKSQRSSITKVTANVAAINIEARSLDDLSSKHSEPGTVPRVYHYTDYIMDIPEERPRSSKSVTTVKSDGAASIKSIRRQNSRPHTSRHSISTNCNEEILRFGTIEVPTSAKNFSVLSKPTSPVRETKPPVKSTNPTMINELMQKYSLIKKNHQELVQAKLHLEKPHADSKMNVHLNKDTSPRNRAPPIPESTLLVSSDHPKVSVKKLLVEPSVPRATVDHTHTNGKLLDRRGTPRKTSNTDVNPQLRIFSLANQQNRQASASSNAFAQGIPTKKTDDTVRTLQRSKTLDVVLDIPNPMNGSSRAPTQTDTTSSNRPQRVVNGFTEQPPSTVSNRSTFTVYAEQQRYQQHNRAVIRTTQQPFNHTPATTSISTNKVLVHYNHSKNENRNHTYILPE